jgi:dihydrofolate synthase/folylpolyglutamate synthase
VSVAEDAIARLRAGTAEGIRFGLERMEAVLAGAGDPHRQFRAIHVGGTNGKGSVAATAAAVLHGAGVRTGRFTSPPLASWRECVWVAGGPLPEDELARCTERLAEAIRTVRPTFFEALTAVAFLAFARARTQVAVVEVGMGGADDATNVVVSAVCVLTGVALDHVRELGGSVGEIARVKAGIIKPGVPVVVAEGDPAALAEFRARARAVDAPFHLLSRDEVRAVRWSPEGTRFTLATQAWGTLELRTPLVGWVHAMNAALAVRALELLPAELHVTAEEVTAGVASVRWPGRLQVETRADGTWVYDVAHNPAAVESLASTLRELPLPRPLVVVAGILADKDWARMLASLAALADRLVLTVPPSAPVDRRWDPALAARTPGIVAETAADFRAALARARMLAGAGTVLVTGSHHTVGDALARARVDGE